MAEPIVAANGVDPEQPTTELEVPSPDVLVGILDSWAELRKDARVLLVLDISGSMGDPGGDGRTKLDLAIEAAVSALDQFKDADEVGLWVFSTELGGPDPNVLDLVPIAPIGAQRDVLAQQIEAQRPTNGTPLYEVTDKAYESMLAEYDPTKINAIVLLTDGQNDDGNPGDDEEQFAELIQSLQAGSEGSSAQPVRLFTIAYGEDADAITLRAVAQATRAATYNASNPATIEQVFTAVISQLLTWRGARSATASSPSAWRRRSCRRSASSSPAPAPRPGSSSDCRSPPPPASVRSPGAVACWRPCRASASSARVAPSSLSEPWRSYGVQAEDAKRRFDHVVGSVAPGPLRERLELMSGRLDDGVDESWRIARRGHEIGNAIGKIDTVSAEAELADLRRRLGPEVPSPAQAQTIEALEAQLASANRLTTLAEQSRDRLRLLDARFDELLARTVEVSVGAGDTEVLGEDVDGLVSELEALRIAMDEAGRAGEPDRAPPAGLPCVSSLLRSNLVVASGTALSRISGLARITVFGYVIGQTALADAYRIGNETPNIVYELLLGGVLSATLVPLFTSFDENDDEESTNVVVTVSLVAARRRSPSSRSSARR